MKEGDMAQKMVKEQPNSDVENLLNDRENLIEVVKAFQNFLAQQQFLGLTSRKHDQEQIVNAAYIDYLNKLEYIKPLL